MAETIVTMAKDLVMALIRENLLAPEDMQAELQRTHASLLELKAKEEGGLSSGEATEGTAPRHVDWKKSIKKHSVECLVCGATFKQLSARHLSSHDLPTHLRGGFG